MQQRLIHNVIRISGGVVGENVWINLGYVAILAKVARQVAPETSDGKYGAAGKKMIQWLFLNRVGGYGRKYSIALGEQIPIPVHTGVALSKLIRIQNAIVRTKQTLNGPVFPGFIEGCRLHDIKLQRKTDQIHPQTKQQANG